MRYGVRGCPYNCIFWRLIAKPDKRDNIDNINEVANKTANILFYGSIIIFVILVIFFSK
ncbi:protein of unknown function [Candidatus Nitrotoga arctica]|uniref:Uncharacterized protein n=1 Tax=Candidatus Nitrotoga arctica TaxID=453162 RepID=A0ABM8YW81_9PROT|nr:protein of unknown function [Candidatus Nitrotoga arctica]